MSEEQRTSPACDDVLSYLYLYLDKELPPGDRTHVQAHLDECIPCLEAFEFEAELKIVVKSRCQDEVPDHLADRIRAALRDEVDVPESSA